MVIDTITATVTRESAWRKIEIDMDFPQNTPGESERGGVHRTALREAKAGHEKNPHTGSLISKC
jgi:hypothetical protein